MDDLVRRLPPVGLVGRLGPTWARRRALGRWMARLNPDRLALRQDLLDWAVASDPVDLDWMRPKVDLDGPVTWSFWHSGEDAAPGLVARCLASQREQGRHLLLDDSTYPDYLDLPPWFVDRRDQVGIVKFSNVLRLALLAAYGGTWADATVLLTGPPPAPSATGPFFAFTRPSDPLLVANWYLRADARHPLVVAWLELQLRFWRDHTELPDYFLMHLLFEVVVLLDPALMAAWAAVPVLEFGPQHLLQERLREPFDPAGWADVQRASTVHKLTYKVDLSECAPNSYWERLTTGQV